MHHQSQTTNCTEEKNLSGTSWEGRGEGGGQTSEYRKILYVGRIRSVLEFGEAARRTASKSNFYKVNKVLN